MMRKMLTVLAAAFVGLFALGGVSNAAPVAAYPPPPITVIVNVNISIVINGDVIIFTGSGFDPGELISILTSFSAPSGLRSSSALTDLAAAQKQTTTADSSGAFSADVQLNQVGTATITATGVSSGKTASAVVTVLAAGSTIPAGTSGSSTYVSSGTSSTELASTGASIAGPIAIGVAALFAGLALLFFGTRGVIRRKSTGGSSV